MSNRSTNKPTKEEKLKLETEFLENINEVDFSEIQTEIEEGFISMINPDGLVSFLNEEGEFEDFARIKTDQELKCHLVSFKRQDKYPDHIQILEKELNSRS
jgi:hypothetical protein|tara:strand:- start:817 stop:1119 length:303 start_codon:yes stop_codon:yes gene_type:complete